MKIAIKSKIVFGVIWGLLACVPMLSSAADQDDQGELLFPPIIIMHPEDILVQLGQNVTFTVAATAVTNDLVLFHLENESLDHQPKDLTYQWVFKGNLIPDGTNDTLTIYGVTTNDVGFYSCAVYRESKDDEKVFVMTQPALLSGWTTNSPVTVWSYPPPGGSGSGSGCPYPYIGYINYYVPCPPPGNRCGFSTNSDSPKTATDITRTDTKIKFFGSTFGNNGCGTGGFVTVSPLNSATYKFCVYFPSSVPTNAYPLQLNGFNPN